MKDYIIKKLLLLVPTVLAITFLVFSMMQLIPGDPIFLMLGDMYDQRQADELRREYGLDQPLIVQYGNYLKGLVQGDLGISFKQAGRSVSDIVREHFPVSIKLGLMSLSFAALFGIFLGVLAAARQNQGADHVSMSFALLGISMPSFVLAPLLILIFAIQLALLPPARIEGFTGFILPSMTLGLIFTGVIARLSRTGMLETVRQDYIRTARAKGLSERQVIWKHAVRLGLLPVVTYLGPATAQVIVGSFVVEKIFQVPGLGFYFIESVTLRDYTVLSGVLIVYSIFLVALNLVVDVLYGVLDPRIRSRR